MVSAADFGTKPSTIRWAAAMLSGESWIVKNRIFVYGAILRISSLFADQIQGSGIELFKAVRARLRPYETMPVTWSNILNLDYTQKRGRANVGATFDSTEVTVPEDFALEHLGYFARRETD